MIRWLGYDVVTEKTVASISSQGHGRVGISLHELILVLVASEWIDSEDEVVKAVSSNERGPGGPVDHAAIFKVELIGAKILLH